LGNNAESKAHDLQSHGIEELLNPEELLALGNAIKTVFDGPGYGSINLEIKNKRIYLVSITMTIRPGITNRESE